MIKVTCSKCGKELKAPDELEGKQGKCPDCGEIMKIGKKDDIETLSAASVLSSDKDDVELEQGVTKCPYCTENIATKAVMCRHCGSKLIPQKETKTCGKAIASLVCSIFGFSLCPFVGSILGLIFGYTARNQIKDSQGWMSGSGMATAGIIIGWFGMIIPFAAILAAMLLPALSRAREQARRASCMNNVRSLVQMCHMYAIDNDEVFPSSFADLEKAGYTIGNLTHCPTGGDNAYGLNVAACPITSHRDTPLIADFDSSNHLGEGGNIGYVDGSTRWHVDRYEAGAGPLRDVQPEDWVRQ